MLLCFEEEFVLLKVGGFVMFCLLRKESSKAIKEETGSETTSSKSKSDKTKEGKTRKSVEGKGSSGKKAVKDGDEAKVKGDRKETKSHKEGKEKVTEQKADGKPDGKTKGAEKGSVKGGKDDPEKRSLKEKAGKRVKEVRMLFVLSV